MTTQLVDLHPILSGLWQELDDTDLTSQEGWRDVSVSLQFSGVPGLMLLGSELYHTLRRDITGKLFSPNAELKAIHQHVEQAIGAAYQGEAYPSAALLAINSLRINTQQNLYSASAWAPDIVVQDVPALTAVQRERLQLWLSKATQLFKLAMMQLLKGQPEGLLALKKLLPRTVAATASCASHPLWQAADAFIDSLDEHSVQRRLPQLLLRYVLQSLNTIATSNTPEQEAAQTKVLARQLWVFSQVPTHSDNWRLLAPNNQFSHAQEALMALQSALLDFFEDGSEFAILKSVPARAADLAKALKQAEMGPCADYASTLSDYVEQQVLSRKLLPSAERIDQLTRVVISIEWALRLAAWGLPWQQAWQDGERSHDKLLTALGESSPAEETPTPSAQASRDNVLDIDPELLDIFVEEAREVLDEIRAELAKDSLSSEALADIRRGFHTIKGSGRMVGAVNIGEFGWQLENTYNQLLQGGSSLQIDHVELINTAVEEFTSMVDGLEQFGSDSMTGRAEKLCALLQRQGHRDAPTTEEWLAVLSPDNVSLDTAPKGSAPKGYVAPAVAVLNSFLQRARQQAGHVEVPTEVVRAVHDLRLEVKKEGDDHPIYRLLAPLESKLKLALRLDNEALDLLKRAVELLQQFAAGSLHDEALLSLQQRIEAWDFAQTAAVESAMSSLLNVGDILDSMYPAMLSHDLAFDWHGHAEQLQAEVQALNESQPTLAAFLAAMADFILRHITDKQVLSHLEPAMAHAFDALNLIAADQTPVIDQLMMDRLAEQLEGVAPEMEDTRQEVASPLTKSFFETTPKPLLESADEDASDMAPSGTQPPGKSQAESVQDEVDPELIDIFQEEAQELIEAIDASLMQWTQSPKESQPKADLQRQLHTLKGGARMVNWRDMAATAHTFESDVLALHGAPGEGEFNHWRRHWQALASMLQSRMQSSTEEANDDVQTDTAAKPKAIDVLKIPVDSLDEMANIGGELTISRSQLDEQRRALLQVVNDLASAQQRTVDQLRRLETQTQAQVAYRREQLEATRDEDFDPLEMDRYTQLQQLTNALMESISDIGDLKSTADDLLRNMETTLVQQGRMSTSLVQKLHTSRMIPVSRLIPRLRRLVEQIGQELGKSVEFRANKMEGELQRSVLERIGTSLEHIVRNALDHGIEDPELRREHGKPETGEITLSVERSDNELVFIIADDGKGIDQQTVLAKARQQGLIAEDEVPSPEDILRITMRPGFSTAERLSEISGRGVGMDVVDNELLSLGGRVDVQSTLHQGTQFTLAVPFSQSVNRALLVEVKGQAFAVPFAGVDGIMRVSQRELAALRGETESLISYGKQHYRFCELADLLGLDDDIAASQGGYSPLVLVRSADGNFAVRVDALKGSRELAVKSLGPQFGKLLGIAGATIMGDGSVISILDLPPLLRAWQQGLRFVIADQSEVKREHRASVMIVDDSITVRKITSRLLQRHDYHVITAKDGVDALEQLDNVVPDIILLDVEMPRMDGFEFASQVRHSERWRQLPIIMVSSRSGDKHRRRAKEVGVNELLSKPYREEVLLDMISGQLQHVEEPSDG